MEKCSYLHKKIQYRWLYDRYTVKRLTRKWTTPRTEKNAPQHKGGKVASLHKTSDVRFISSIYYQTTDLSKQQTTGLSKQARLGIPKTQRKKGATLLSSQEGSEGLCHHYVVSPNNHMSTLCHILSPRATMDGNTCGLTCLNTPSMSLIHPMGVESSTTCKHCLRK